MTDEREQERLRAALREAAEPGSRGIDVDAVLSGSRRRRRPRVALAGGALAVALIASGAGLAGGLLPQAAVMTASDTSEQADAPAATAETFSTDGGGESGGEEPSEGQPQERSGADACAAPDAALAADRGIAVGIPRELERDGATAVTIGGEAALRGEVVVESIALLDAGRVAAVLLGADGASAVDVVSGATTEVAVQGALIGCGDGPPSSGDYEAVATIRFIAESGASSMLRSATQPIALR